MSRAKVIFMLAIALATLSASLPSLAKGSYHSHGHGHSHGSVSFGFVFGGPWYYPGYYYPYYYPQPVPVRSEPTVYIERDASAEPAQGSQGYWYYCKESRAYHPYVKHCPGGWEKQVPAPAPER